MTNNYILVEKSRATKWIRFLNYIIDILILYVIAFLLGGVLVWWYALTESEVAYSMIQFVKNNGEKPIGKLTGLLVTSIFLFLQEWLLKGRTFAKFITGTKVVNENNDPLNIIDLLRRNFIRAIPFEALTFLGNVGLHDKWSNTRVVNVRQFEESLRLRNEMEEIGQVVV